MRLHIPKTTGLLLFAFVLNAVGVSLSAAKKAPSLLGESLCAYTLAENNTEVRGLAFDDASTGGPRLFALDGSGRIFAYGLQQESESETLKLLQTYDLSAMVGSSGLASPRGLALAIEQGRAVFYFLDWEVTDDDSRSRLWRYVPGDGTSSWIDFSLYMYRVGDRELMDLAYEDGRLLVSYDASGYLDQNLRVQRGILRIEWEGTFGENPASVRHLPDAGTSPARGLAAMQMDDTRYLWATVGNDHVCCVESRTGRGLFFFDRPKSHEGSPSCWGMCFGKDALWVSENVPGPDRVHRVNVTKNLDAALEGPRVPRRLIMTIQTEPEADCEDAGAVYHYYSRPYAYEQLQNQGVWPETELVMNASPGVDPTILQMTLDPAGDASARQTMQCVEYANAPARGYSSAYHIEFWTNPYKKFVYPHRVDQDRTALEGTDYLADDPELYNLSDAATYESFIRRVRTHIKEKYGVQADMQNPYWAARNVVEYIQDNYYYPSRPKRKPATVDYDRQHYDANPGSLKIDLSAKPYDKTQIIACSGTSVMVAGAMRHLGIPARWLGTGTQLAPDTWDDNANGLLDPEETAPCSNGHRYTQVWLGSHYGWICFDATPSKPDFNDYDPPPPLQSQWRYMTRAASGHRKDNRIVFNVGSELIRPLYRDFEYDQKLAVDNNCGGDQRYNLQGRYENPELWKLARHGIQVKNVCFIDHVEVNGSGANTRITWQLKGDWHRIFFPGLSVDQLQEFEKGNPWVTGALVAGVVASAIEKLAEEADPEAKPLVARQQEKALCRIGDATVSMYLQQSADDASPWRDVARVAKEIPASARSTVVDLSGHSGKRFRVIIRRDGDPETGGTSSPFDLD